MYKTCPQCGDLFEQRSGPGRPRIYCSHPCTLAAHTPVARRSRRATLTCVLCAAPMWHGSTSLPQGQATCLPCRRSRAKAKPEPVLAECATCHGMFEANRRTAKYCSRECSPWCKKAKSPTARTSLGARHQQLRRAFAILVEQGEELCVICSDPIEPGTPWDLDHTPDREGYRSAAHASCNRSEGAARMHRAASL